MLVALVRRIWLTSVQLGIHRHQAIVASATRLHDRIVVRFGQRSRIVAGIETRRSLSALLLLMAILVRVRILAIVIAILTIRHASSHALSKSHLDFRPSLTGHSRLGRSNRIEGQSRLEAL